MQITADYNQPLGKATIYLGGYSKGDDQFEYWVGLKKLGKQKQWFQPDRKKGFGLTVDDDEVVMFKKRDKETKEIIDQQMYSIASTWPSRAGGATITQRTLGYL